jgi:transposase
MLIVVGTDTHKHTHTSAAVDRPTAALEGEITVPAREEGYERLLRWARGLDREILWAIEDCRHVSGGLERFLLRRGEQVVRVPPKLMGEARKGERSFGKSDSIDALAVARAALKEPDLPVARLAGPQREIALLLDHREDLVCERTRIQNRLRWHLHDLDPELESGVGSLSRTVQLTRLARRLRRYEQTTLVSICRELVRRCAELTRRANELESELRALIRRQAPALLELPGCGVITAAKLVAEIAGVERFASDAKLAQLAGVAPLDASSGRQLRHRLNRKGNRQLNRALHTIAKTQVRTHEPARAYLARRMSEGKTRREAMRALKRHLARHVFILLKSISQPMERPTTVELHRAPPVPCLT